VWRSGHERGDIAMLVANPVRFALAHGTQLTEINVK
jgi:hypothetical protein